MRLRLPRELSEHSEHLLSGDHHQAEGQVSGHFDGASDMYIPVDHVQMQLVAAPARLLENKGGVDMPDVPLVRS